MKNYKEKRKVQANDTKQKIYKSAEKLFSCHDYKNVSVNEIVKAAGVAKGSFYVHFPSKNALITTLINDYVTNVDAGYTSYLDSFQEDVPTEMMLLSMIKKIADMLVDTIGIHKMQAVYKAQVDQDVNVRAVMNYERELYKIFRKILERGIARGELNAQFSVDILLKHIMIAIRGVTYEWCIRYPEFDYKTEVVEHFKLLFYGLRQPSPSNKTSDL